MLLYSFSYSDILINSGRRKSIISTKRQVRTYSAFQHKGRQSHLLCPLQFHPDNCPTSCTTLTRERGSYRVATVFKISFTVRYIYLLEVDLAVSSSLEPSCNLDAVGNYTAQLY